MKPILVATFGLFLSLAAQAGNPPRTYLITNPDARAEGCPPLAVSSVYSPKKGSLEISQMDVNLESGDGGVATSFRRVSACKAGCEVYDASELTTGYGEKMTIMFSRDSAERFKKLTVLSNGKTCSYTLTDMGLGLDIDPIDTDYMLSH